MAAVTLLLVTLIAYPFVEARNSPEVSRNPGRAGDPEARARAAANKQTLSDAAKAIDESRLTDAEDLLDSLAGQPYVMDDAYAYVKMSLLVRQGKKAEAFTLAKKVFYYTDRDGRAAIGGSSSGLLCLARLAEEVGDRETERAIRKVLLDRCVRYFSTVNADSLDEIEVKALSFVAVITQGGGGPDILDLSTCKYAVELAPTSPSVLYCYASTAADLGYYEDCLAASRAALELWQPDDSEALRHMLRSLRNSSMQMLPRSKPRFGPGKNPIEGLEFHHFIFGRQPGSPFNPPPD